MDATASILQILATVSCSIKLAGITNLIQSNEPIDTWSYIHHEIINSDKCKLNDILEYYFMENVNHK